MRNPIILTVTSDLFHDEVILAISCETGDASACYALSLPEAIRLADELTTALGELCADARRRLATLKQPGRLPS